jgi:hypothetical protein
MDHNGSVRQFEHLMIKEADPAHEAATELEALVSLLPREKSRQLAQEFREVAQKVKASYSPAHCLALAVSFRPPGVAASADEATERSQLR